MSVKFKELITKYFLCRYLLTGIKSLLNRQAKHVVFLTKLCCVFFSSTSLIPIALLQPFTVSPELDPFPGPVTLMQTQTRDTYFKLHDNL